ncbi:hypothetical protein [Gemmatimonas sp.]
MGLVACGESSGTGPTPAPGTDAAWASGTWVAVRLDGQPLPHRDAPTYPYLQTDSLKVSVLIIGTTRTASVYPYARSFFSASTTPTALGCGEALAPVTILSTSLSTSAVGATTNIGGCNTNWVTMTLTRKADSLAGTWLGRDIRLVKR